MAKSKKQDKTEDKPKKVIRTTKHGRNSKQGRGRKSRSDLGYARYLGRIQNKHLRNLSKAIQRTKLAVKSKYEKEEGLNALEWR
jgi:hypothetical protein